MVGVGSAFCGVLVGATGVLFVDLVPEVRFSERRITVVHRGPVQSLAAVVIAVIGAVVRVHELVGEERLIGDVGPAHMRRNGFG